jgi:hypothetical protein
MEFGLVRRVIAIGASILMLSLGLVASGEAQSTQPDSTVKFQAVVRAVDCEQQQLTLAGPGAVAVVQSTLGTVIQVDGAPTPLCGLSTFVGAHATAWVIARAGQIVLTRLEVVSAGEPPGAASVAPPPSPSPSVYSSVPTAAPGVLGTVVAGGGVYLLVLGADGALYRYAYYGPYGHPPAGPYGRYVGPYTRIPAYTYDSDRPCQEGTFWQWCR